MKRHIEPFFKKHSPLLASFFIPFTIMLVIYIFQGVYPFGDSSLLTIDLGQQYIDFFADFKANFLTNPLNMFYSFHKSLGGEMIGLWAYYLTSPFNLFFLFFKQASLSFAVTLLTLLKIGFMGTSFFYYIKNVFPGKKSAMLLFSSAYALMGYNIVYQLNLMWLDGVIFLPLICLAIEKLILSRKGTQYALILGLTLFSSYYIGYMICLFLPFFFLFRLISTHRAEKRSWKDTLSLSGLFTFYSVLSAGLASILLLPVFSTLLTSKAGYMNSDFSFKWAYPPQELLSKFFVGAFNFDQMPSGLPTVFVGSAALICFFYYLFDKRFLWSERLFVCAWTVFLIVSMNVEALNKIWHAMQFPVWFPYRFSFLFGFWILLNGYRAFSKGIDLTRTQFLLALGLSLVAVAYVWMHLKDFDYLSVPQLLITTVILAALLFVLWVKGTSAPWFSALFIGLAIAELAGNAAVTLSRLSYIDDSKYTYEVQSLSLFSDAITQQDDGFYRTEKTFQRSKNDAHQAQYKGITHFSSTYEQKIPELFKHLGFSAHNGFVVYSNSTLLTDSFFGVKYYLNQTEDKIEKEDEAFTSKSDPTLISNPFNPPKNFQWNDVQTKPDLDRYSFVQSFGDVEVRENPFVLPVAFGSSDLIKQVNTLDTHPIDLQNDLLNALGGHSLSKDFFVEESFSALNPVNASVKGSRVNRKVQKNAHDVDASLEFVFGTNKKDSYYMTFNPSIKEKDADLFLNNEPFHLYHTYYKPVVLNVASEDSPRIGRFKIDLNKNELNTTAMNLYRLDTQLFEKEMSLLQKGGLEVTSSSNNRLKGTVFIQPNQSLLLFTIPYSEGWKAKVDGKEVTLYDAVDGLMAVDMDPGKHTVELRFTPPLLLEGAVVSLFSFFLLVLLDRKKQTRNERR